MELASVAWVEDWPCLPENIWMEQDEIEIQMMLKKGWNWSIFYAAKRFQYETISTNEEICKLKIEENVTIMVEGI